MDNNETNINNEVDESTGLERPHRFHRRPASEDKYFKIRNVLNIIFMLGATSTAVQWAQSSFSPLWPSRLPNVASDSSANEQDNDKVNNKNSTRFCCRHTCTDKCGGTI